jgi:hypothetical protein
MNAFGIPIELAGRTPGTASRLSSGQRLAT